MYPMAEKLVAKVRAAVDADSRYFLEPGGYRLFHDHLDGLARALAILELGDRRLIGDDNRKARHDAKGALAWICNKADFLGGEHTALKDELERLRSRWIELEGQRRSS
jgi:hypothetical protein